jgi:aldehyde:ferredoxin oxidoreductase
MGWQGKILRVDLSAGTTKSEPLNMTWAKEYLGSRGLASRYLFDEMDPTIDPLDPENRLIFATGPLTGTMASTGGRYTVVTKGALTNAITCSNSGGYFGAELKFAGYDMIIVQGKAAHPVYLMINDDKVEIHDARDFLWGETVWETEEKIKTRHQDPLIKIASIGKAGEELVRYACIVNDRDRAAGRSGVGTVMGSKMLKAIGIRGTQGVAPDKPEEFMKAVRMGRDKLDPHPARKRLMSSGTMPMMDATNAYGSLPTRNCQDVQFDGIDKVNVRAMQTKRRSDGQANLITNKACFGCSIGCGRVSKMDPSHFSIQDPDKKKRYSGAIGGLEYESGFSLASMVGVYDIEAATYANMLCNEHGMDPISFGVTVSAAMELYETGAITNEQTDGLKVTFGNAEALCKLVELTGAGEGFGKDIGLGAKRLCDKYGHPEFAIVVKGQEFPGYDTRAMQGMGLAYATSNRGACHMRASPFVDDFTHVRPDGKAAIVKITQDKNAAVDSTGCCAFAGNAWDIADYAAHIHGACEGDWDEERLMETGERIFNIERLFNLKSGMTKADDTLPHRMLKEAAKSGAGKGHVTELDKMLPEYYDVRGWDQDGDIPQQTRQRLNIS